jgi:GNAT superfamily N-acetyltransferase
MYLAPNERLIGEESNMSNTHAGKVAIVTGSARGIGAAIASQLARESAKVVVNYNNGKTAAESVVPAILRDDGKALAVQADVRTAVAAERLFTVAEAEFGPVDWSWLRSDFAKIWTVETIPGRSAIGYAVAVGFATVGSGVGIEIKRLYILHRFQQNGFGHRLMNEILSYRKTVCTPEGRSFKFIGPDYCKVLLSYGLTSRPRVLWNS